MDKNELIYGLTKLYSEIKYNYGMFNKCKIDLDKVFKDYLMDLDNINTKWDYYKLLCRFIKNIDDSNSYVTFPYSLLEEEKIGILPFDILLIDERWYIFSYRKDYEKMFSPFDEILEINDITIEEYFEKNVYPYISSSFRRDTLLIRNTFSFGLTNSSIKIKLKHLDNTINEKIIPYVLMDDNIEWICCKERDLYSK